MSSNLTPLIRYLYTTRPLSVSLCIQFAASSTAHARHPHLAEISGRCLKVIGLYHCRDAVGTACLVGTYQMTVSHRSKSFVRPRADRNRKPRPMVNVNIVSTTQLFYSVDPHTPWGIGRPGLRTPLCYCISIVLRICICVHYPILIRFIIVCICFLLLFHLNFVQKVVPILFIAVLLFANFMFIFYFKK